MGPGQGKVVAADCGGLLDYTDEQARCRGSDITAIDEVDSSTMKFMLVIYNDPKLYGALPQAKTDQMMRECLTHADELRRDGQLTESQMLDEANTAKSVRIRNGRTKITDGPFSEAKEVLGGFNLIEAKDMDEAVRIAAEFPWARTGCVEVRPVRDIGGVRRRVNATPAVS